MISKILHGIPVYVFIILAVLIIKGISDLKDRTINNRTLIGLLALPVIFAIWHIISIIRIAHYPILNFSLSIIMLLLTAYLFYRQKFLLLTSKNNKLMMVGSVHTLIFILLVFSGKFCLQFLLAIDASYAESLAYNICNDLFFGFAIGLCLGRYLTIKHLILISQAN